MKATVVYSVVKKQRGDTIVEVLISLAVIALVLIGAFVLSRTSLNNVRDSEEQGQAVSLLEGQVEQLRAFAGTASSSQIATMKSSTFCFGPSGFTTAIASACSNLGSNNLYDATIRHLPAPETEGTFEATITWDKVGGDQGQAQLVYRVAL